VKDDDKDTDDDSEFDIPNHAHASIIKHAQPIKNVRQLTMSKQYNHANDQHNDIQNDHMTNELPKSLTNLQTIQHIRQLTILNNEKINYYQLSATLKHILNIYIH
jgi:hypothetical protein